MKFPLRQRSYLLGRRAAKAALGVCFPAVPAPAIHIANGVFNQPFVAAGPVDCELSLAHSQHLGVAVVFPPGHPVGIDLEFIDAERSDAAGSCVTAAERPLLDRLGLPPAAAHFLLWTVKEAVGKAIGCGLAVPLESVAISSVGEQAGRFECRFVNFPPFQAAAWILGDYLLSIVLPRKSSLTFRPTPELLALMRSRPASSG